MDGLYSVFDKALPGYMGVFQSPSDNVAVRSFGDMVRSPDKSNPASQHPEMFHLSKVGTWDPAVGAIVPCEPFKLVDALSMVQA